MKRILIVALGVAATSLLWGLAAKSKANHLNWLVPPRYDATYHFSEGYGLAALGVQLFLVDLKGNIRPLPGYRLSASPETNVSILYACIFVSGGRLALVSEQDGKWHYLTAKALTPLKGAWDSADPFSEGKAVVRQGDRYYIIDEQGNKLFEVPGTPDRSQGYAQGLLAVMDENEKWGYINDAGQWLIPPQYDLVLGFAGGMAWVVRGNESCAIDAKATVFPKSCQTGQATWSKGHVALLETETGWILCDGLTGVIASGQGGVLSDADMDDPICVERTDALWSYVGLDGKAITDRNFNGADSFHAGYAVFYEGNKQGVLDREGKVRIPPILDIDTSAQAGDGVLDARYGGRSGFLKLDTGNH